MISEVTDWKGRLLGRLASQYQGKPKLEAVVAAVAAQAQELEGAFYDLLTLRTVDQATGAQLDVLGRIVGLRRDGAIDSIFSQRIRGRIRALRSDGSAPSILAVFRLLHPLATTTIKLIEGFPAEVLVRIVGEIMSPAAAAVDAAFLKQSRAAAVRGIFEWAEDIEAAELVLSSSALYPQTSAAQGLGDSTNPATGGHLAGAAEA